MIRWGMIGCGEVTEVKNGPGLYLCRNSELIGITNRTTDKAKDWIIRHGHGKVYASIEALLDEDAVDIVYIATTPNVHYEQAMMVAQAGKHCYIEKPIAMNYHEVQKIQEAFSKAGKQCFIAFYRRALARFDKIIELIQTGRIGRIHAVNILRYVKMQNEPTDWRYDPNQSGGGLFYETDVHAVDFLIHCFGEVGSYSHETVAMTQLYPFPDTLALNIKFRNGVLASGLWQYSGTKNRDDVEILGSEGTIRFGFFESSAIRLESEQGTESFEVPIAKHVGMELEQRIIDELSGGQRAPCHIEDCMKTMEIVDQMK